MKSYRLPVKLTDRVIDFCHSDKKALSNRALTHSPWLTASRSRLSYTITMTGVHKGTDQPAVQSKWIRKRSPILPYIRTVKIESFNSSDGATGLRNDVLFTHVIRCLYYLKYLPIPSVHVNPSRFRQFSQGPSYDLQPFSRVSDIVMHMICRMSHSLIQTSSGHSVPRSLGSSIRSLKASDSKPVRSLAFPLTEYSMVSLSQRCD